MTIRQLRRFRTVAAFVAVAALAGCASPVEVPIETATPTPTPTAAAPTPTPTQPPQALLVISGTVADQNGQSLTVTLTSTSVRMPTDQDRADYAATRCALSNPLSTFPANPDTRVLTMAVESVASSGFTGWTDARGVWVSGSLFDGSIWDAEAHSPGSQCFSDSRITRPGTGEVRVITSSDDWNLPNAVVGDGSITLATYGFAAVTHDESGLPTGLTAVNDCTADASPELNTLALDLWTGRWGASNHLPEYCYYGRGAGD